MMLDRFTDRAKHALQLAQQEAAQAGFEYIGTEYLLLGLLLEGEGVAAKVLQGLGLSPASLRDMIIKITGRGDGIQESPTEIVLTPRTKRVFELAFEAARRLGHNYIGTEHLLLGIVWEGEGVANKILHEMGVRPEQLHNLVLASLSGVSGIQMQSQSEMHATGMETSQSGTPALDKYSRDLTALAEDGKLDPVVGRQTEIERLLQILSRRTKNNPVLIGDPGVGKTAIVEGLAQKIQKGEVPEILLGKRVVTMDMGLMVAGTKYRGEFEERLNNVVDEIRKSGNVIIFIDELHTIIGAGGAEGALDAANILKPALSRGELQCIGATTINEYRKHIEKDSALERRFQPINVNEPTAEESIQILFGLRDRYEAHHKVKITDAAIKEAVKLSSRYINDRFLPDKAIDLIDEASARIRLQVLTSPQDLREMEKKFVNILKEKEEAIQNQEFEKAAHLRDDEQKLKASLDSMKEKWQLEKKNDKITVDENDIAWVVAGWTGIPVQRFTESEGERLMKLEDDLHRRVIGQDEAVNAVSRAIRRARAGLKDPKRPSGSFIFLGPTGVGKTELARALAESLFGNEDAMIRLDMSEYMEKHTASRLVGAPPGYIGHDEGGQLTDRVRRRPYSLILFDEIEKAHPDVFNMLLQILEDGRLTDNHGRTADFRNTVIIMTSNIGSKHFDMDRSLGFVSNSNIEKSYEKMKDRITDELKSVIKPEFFNRIDDVIVFHPLTKEEIGSIADMLLLQLKNRMQETMITMNWTADAKDKLMDLGYDNNYGARPMRRAIQRNIEDQISDKLLMNEFVAGDTVIVDVDSDGKFVFTREMQPVMLEKKAVEDE